MSTIGERRLAARNGDLAYLKQHVVADNVEEGVGIGWRVLHYAARYGHRDCVVWLVENMNADLDVKTNIGWTPHNITRS